jgi:hypothetical protein
MNLISADFRSVSRKSSFHLSCLLNGFLSIYLKSNSDSGGAEKNAEIRFKSPSQIKNFNFPFIPDQGMF